MANRRDDAPQSFTELQVILPSPETFREKFKKIAVILKFKESWA